MVSKETRNQSEWGKYRDKEEEFRKVRKQNTMMVREQGSLKSKFVEFNRTIGNISFDINERFNRLATENKRNMKLMSIQFGSAGVEKSILNGTT